jgi:methyl-accepting chemotaxis protein
LNNRARRGLLIAPFAAAAVLCLAAVWLIPSRPLASGVVLAVLAAAYAACRLLGRTEEEETRREEEPVLEETSGEAVKAFEGMPVPDASVWGAWKKIWAEADLLLSRAPRAEMFADAWKSFGESLERLSANSKSILENSKKAFDISDNLAGSAEKAFALSQKVQTRVKELTGDLASSLGETRRLYEESKKIAGILEMMSDISSKTYVLSINASVVATRAGSHGRAFDVVAKEIRKLAQDTESSLKNIEDFVAHIQDIVQRVVDNTTVTASEIEKEKDSLLSVAGSLQGVILAVEIIRTVSNLSKDKALEQQAISEDVIAKTRAVALRVQEEASLSSMDPVKEKITELRRILDRY